MAQQGNMEHITVNRTYKDSVFRDLFGAEERRANALELYNALNGSSYTDPSVLDVMTIDDSLWMSVRNDVSFLVNGDEEMVLWEHQSTHNPNMPLRGLVYFAHLYGRWVERSKRNIYASTLIKLPTPQFVVFYNGEGDRPERETLRLSDAFGVRGCVEVEATVININARKNPTLIQASKTLEGYARLVELVRRYHKSMELGAAVDRAVNQCIEEGYLVEYLTAKRAEVRAMFILDYDMEEERRRNETEVAIAREEGIAKGREEGLEEGRAEGREEGLEEGRAEGRAEERRLIVERVAERLGLSEEEVAAMLEDDK